MKYEKHIYNKNCPHRSKDEWCKKSSNPNEWKICIIDKPECFGEEPKNEQANKKETKKNKK